MKKTLILVMVLAIPTVSAQGFTVFPEDQSKTTSTLKENYSLNFAKPKNESYRIEIDFQTDEIEAQDKFFILQNISSDKNILSDGEYIPIHVERFEVKVNENSLKRNHTFTAVVKAAPLESDSLNVGQKVEIERRFEFNLFTESDIIRKNRMNSREYSGELWTSEKTENKSKPQKHNTSIKIERPDSKTSNNKTKTTEKSGSNGLTVLLLIGVALTLGYTVRQLI